LFHWVAQQRATSISTSDPRIYMRRTAMNTRNIPSHARVLTAASAVIAVFGMSACVAATPAFNPDGLQEVQLSRVVDVCQTVMGLSPAERLIGGNWLGDSRLDYWTSRYRGCVTSLSDSVQNVGDAQARQEADRACRAKGYADGSPDLALCVLQSSRQAQVIGNTPQAPARQQGAEKLPGASGSLFYASAHERRQREELACAAVGIEPTGAAFKACVNDLQNTFHAIDTPIS
jgi:hypothetical protein